MRILFLADALPATPDKNYRTIHYRQVYEQAIGSVLPIVPHGVLLGPTLLATILERAGYEVEIIECAFRLRQKERVFSALAAEPELVCISTTYIVSEHQLASIIELVRMIAPQAIIVLGGPSLMANRVMRTLGDYYVLGEGDQALLALVNCLKNGDREFKIPGVYRSNTKDEPVNTPLLSSMDDLPFPNWGLLRRRSDDYFVLATQRGCLWRCAFCTYPEKEGFKMRYRSVPNILAEMKFAYEKWGIHRYLFADSTFTAPVQRCADILRGIKTLPFSIEWMSYARVDTITPELADLMAESGCVSVFFGMESGSESVLKSMKKGFNLDQMKSAVNLMKERGIAITASWIVGFPGETRDTVTETVTRIEELGCDQNYLSTFVLEQQAPVSRRLDHYGLQGTQTNWSHGSMSYEEALELTSSSFSYLTKKGYLMGNLFEFSWLSSLGYSTHQITDLFRRAQTEAVTNPMGISAGLKEELSVLREKASIHPIYSH